MALNPGQESGLRAVVKWWKSPRMYMVLDGKGGVGKSYLVDSLLQALPNTDPILLAPTNEALKQLRDKVTGDYQFRTIDSALGMRPTTYKKELDFEHSKLPSFWSDINLAVIDECSMVGQDKLDILTSIGVKILFVGHGSQLPNIVLRRKILDKCVSPVFNQEWETVELTQPMRNTGDLWDFNCTVESMIYDKSIRLPTMFDAKRTRVREFLNDEKDSLLSGDTKMVMWSNNEVDAQNARLRQGLFGDDSKKSKYLPGDKIILTSPMTVVEGLEHFKAGDLEKLCKSREALDSLYSNSKATVISSTTVSLYLHSSISFRCYKITVECEGVLVDLYEPVNEFDRESVAVHYEHKAWQANTPTAKMRAYMLRHFMLSCFASIKHYFAATSHRLQGSSVKNIIVMHSDIIKNSCVVEAAKCRYVATSRAMDNLLVYRGI